MLKLYHQGIINDIKPILIPINIIIVYNTKLLLNAPNLAFNQFK